MEQLQHPRRRRQPTPPIAWWLTVIVDAVLLVAAMYGLASSQTWAGRIFAGVVLVIDWAIFGWLMANRPSEKRRSSK